MPVEAFVADFVAGWVAGGASLLLGHPLDTIKVRMQALKGYEGALQCVSQTLRQEAIGGFYKGMLFPFMSTGFLHSIYFGGHGATLKLLRGPGCKDVENGNSSFTHLLTASIVGAAVQWIPACPIEIVKTKLQIQKEAITHIWNFNHIGHLQAIHGKIGSDGRMIFSSPWDCLRRTVYHEGMAGLYRGGLIMLLRDVVGFCFYLPVYENVKRALTPLPRTNDLLSPWTSSIVDFDHIAEIFDPDYGYVSIFRSSESHRHRLAASLIAGAVAGVASWFSILPLDVIKSRLQADDIVRPKYTGIWNCARESFRTEGFCFLIGTTAGSRGDLNGDGEVSVLEQQYLLYSHLLNSSRYNPRCDPTVLHAINVSFYLEFHQLLNLDESTQTVRLAAWVQLDWKDAQLYWNPSNYGNISVIATPYEDVWIPRTDLVNTVEMDKATTEYPTVVYVTVDPQKDPSHAFVMFGFNAIFKFSCPINMWLFPFDIQRCIMIFEPVLDVSRLKFSLLLGDTINTDYYRANEEWSMVKSKIKLSDMKFITNDIPFSRVTATFWLQRRPMYYVSTIVLPMILIGLFASIGLFVPVDTPECAYDKLSLGMTALLTFSIQLLQVSSQVPKGSSTVPMLSWFFLGMMTQTTIGTLIAVWLCEPENCEKVKKICLAVAGCRKKATGHWPPPLFRKTRSKIFLVSSTGSVPSTKDRGGYRSVKTGSASYFAHMLFTGVFVSLMLVLMGGIFVMAAMAQINDYEGDYTSY